MKGVFLSFMFVVFLVSVLFAKIGGGDISFEVKGAGNVTFSHDNHAGASGLKCTDCHDSLYVAKEKHKKVAMAQMGQGKSCGACHNGKKAFDVKGSCANCHKK
jgi:c(7)-type cytochrome triheme protein